MNCPDIYARELKSQRNEFQGLPAPSVENPRDIKLSEKNNPQF